MNLTRLTSAYHIGVAEKRSNKARNETNLTRIASTLQQVSNRQILQSVREYFNEQ